MLLAEVPPFPYDLKGRSPEELEILELARRRVTIRRLAWAAGGVTLPRLRAAYALLGAGILREADAAVAPQPVLQTETGMFLLSALQSRPDPSLREAIRREVQQELQHSARLDRDGWLKLARTAPRDELVRALEDKMERYHALRDSTAEDDNPLRTDIDVVLGRAAAALRVARHAPETASAEAVLARHAAAAAAAVSPPAAPPVAPAQPPPAPPALTPAPESGLTQPPVVVPSPVAAFREQTRPARPPEEPSQPPLRPDDSLRIAPGSSGFEGQALVEHLLMEGEVRMTVADYANAVKVYEKLVDTAPRVAAFHLRLAVAMACYPRSAKMAEREFYEAARLEPDNADDPLPVGSLLQGDEGAQPRRGRDAHRRAPRPAPHGPRAPSSRLSRPRTRPSPRSGSCSARDRLPGPDQELVEEGERQEDEGELRLVRCAVLGGAPQPGGRQQRRQHPHDHEQRGAEAQPSLEAVQRRAAEDAAEQQVQVQHVDEQGLVTEQRERAGDEALRRGAISTSRMSRSSPPSRTKRIGRARRATRSRPAPRAPRRTRPPSTSSTPPATSARRWRTRGSARPSVAPASVPASTNAEKGKSGKREPVGSSR